jgi:hypothetical protein
MKRELDGDLARLEKLAFKRRQRCGALIRRFHELSGHIELMGEAEWIWNVYDWLLAPLTLWPIDFEGMGRHTIRILEGKVKLDRGFWLLLRMLRPPPARKAQEAIARYEHEVEKGRYHGMMRQPAKFEEMEAALKKDELLGAMWEEVKEQFATGRYRNKRGVIRRRLSQERNFREGWRFDWGEERSRFYAVFDAFCYAWDLYGMEKDKPLLMKVSVNPTPYGTLIFIPRTHSFDAYRDLDWGAIAQLHRAQGVAKQGPKLSRSRVELRREAARAKKLWEQAENKGLTGDERYEWVCRKMGKDERTDPSWLYRLLRKGGGAPGV